MKQADMLSKTKEPAIAELTKHLKKDLISEARIRSLITKIYAFKNGLIEYEDPQKINNFLEEEEQKGYRINDMQCEFNLNQFSNDYIKIINKITGRESEKICVAYTHIEEMTKIHARNLNNKIKDHIEAIKTDQRNKYLDNKEAAEKFLADRSHRSTSLYEGILDEDVRNFISDIQQKIKEAETDRIRKKREERKAKEQKEEALRKAWIENHGSDRLKTMYKEGYEYRMTYEQERCEAEFPEFELDEAGDKFGWEDRANPSQDALDQAIAHKEHGGEVVWLVLPYEPCEAIIIKPEWSRYHLVKTI